MSAGAIQQKIRVLVADDHFVVRLGLTTVINSQPDMAVVAQASNGQQALELYRSTTPDVTLMDLRMPVMTGLDAIKAIRAESPEARIIVLTTYDGDEDIYRALQAGAHGYLLKEAVQDDLLVAIRAVSAGRRYIPPAIAARLAERMPLSDLTARETEILKLIVKGLNNADIASILKITRGTVKMHINSILGKLGVSDRTQAATTAIQRGLVHLDE